MATVGKIKDSSIYLSGNISERLPVVRDGLLAYYSFDGTTYQRENHFSKTTNFSDLSDFRNWSGLNTYRANETIDGTLMGNPIIRCEQSGSASGYFYAYGITGVDVGDTYVFSCIAKTSNSTESTVGLDGLYGGHGTPWTAGNYVSNTLWSKVEHIGNGWWRFARCFTADLTDVALSYRDRIYLGLSWSWSTSGTYVWATCPMLYPGTEDVPYPSVLAYDTNTRQYGYSGIGITRATTNLWTGGFTIYNNYAVPATLTQLEETYQGQPIYRLKMTPSSANISNFQTALSSHGVYGSSITYLANTKYASSIFWRPVNRYVEVGGTASNIGGWTHQATYNMKDGWYRTVAHRDGTVTSDKTGHVFWSFRAPDAIADEPIYVDWCCPQIEQGDIYAMPYTPSSASRPRIDFDPGLIRNEGTLIFKFIPLADNTDGTYPTVITANWWSNPLVNDWVGIYRGNGWGSADTMSFAVSDGTNGAYVHSSSISGVNSRIGHELVLGLSWSKTSKTARTFAYDRDTGDILLNSTGSLASFEGFQKGISSFYLGSLGGGSTAQNAVYSDIAIYYRQLSEDEFIQYAKGSLSINNYGSAFVEELKESNNILDKWEKPFFETGQFTTLWGKYEQTDCHVYASENTYSSKSNYSYFIKREPNILSTSYTNWGGLRLTFPDDGTWEEGATYRLSFRYFGYSQDTISIYFAYSVGYTTMGVGLSALNLSSITGTFVETDGWHYNEQEFTIPAGYIHQTGTDESVYYCMKELKIGYEYTNTDSIGTRLFIDDLQIVKTSDGTNNFGIKPSRVYFHELAENKNPVSIYAVGTGYTVAGTHEIGGNRMLIINGTTIYNTTGRGLRFTVVNGDLTVASDTLYDVYSDDAARTNLAAALAAVGSDQYWFLTSFDAINTNSTLSSQLSNMGSNVWAEVSSYRSSYAAVGKYNKIIHETGSGAYNTTDKHKAVIDLVI